MAGTNEHAGGIESLMTPTGMRVSVLTKMMLSFIAMIALTIIVVAITEWVQWNQAKVRKQEVEVYSNIDRLSLESNIELRGMISDAQNFLIQYPRMGYREAREVYASKVINGAAGMYKSFTELSCVIPIEGEKKVVQGALQAVNTYTAAFLGSVYQVELLADPAFGLQLKSDNALKALGDLLKQNNLTQMTGLLNEASNSYHVFLLRKDAESKEQVFQKIRTIAQNIRDQVTDQALKAQLQPLAKEFEDTFANLAHGHEGLIEKEKVYGQATTEVEQAISNLVKTSRAQQVKANVSLDNISAWAQKIVLIVGVAAVILGLLLAWVLSKGLTRQIDQIMELLSEIGIGNFSARTKVLSNDELGDMAIALNGMLDNITVLIQSQDERDSIQDSIIKLMEEISDLTQGDLTARAEVTEDITGAIADSFNTMADQFGAIVRQVQSATGSVDETATDVAKLTGNLAEKSGEQSKQVSTAIEAINEMTELIRQVSRNAAQSAEVSAMSRSNARQGAEAVAKTNQAMDEIREQINETARSIKRLGESSMEIGNVVEIINTIADRTSILALNASIQAAMAGDAGYGFSVVAEEVQRLAEGSSNSTKQIEMLVKSIQSDIKDVSNRMDESISKVVQGANLADNAHAKLQEIESVSNQLADLVESITQAAANQVRMSETVTESMVTVGGLSEDTAKATRETVTLMTLLNDTSRDLRKAVDAFKIEVA